MCARWCVYMGPNGDGGGDTGAGSGAGGDQYERKESQLAGVVLHQQMQKEGAPPAQQQHSTTCSTPSSF